MTTSRNQSNVSRFSGKTTSFKNHAKNNIPQHKEATKYDWDNKWLKGEEYANMLNNLDLYCQTYDLAKLSAKTHPPSIYTEPENGMIYFVEGNSVGSDFGFPRVDTKKHYRWKKMNFTTDLPKKRPYVTYIVASAVKCERFFPNSKDEGPSYRMHAVILNKDRVHTQKYKSKTTPQAHHHEHDEHSQGLSSTCSSSDSFEHEKNEMMDEILEARQTPGKGTKNYILCHIRKIDSNYKIARANGKKGSLSKDEDCGEDQEDEEEEEEDDEEVEDVVVKKHFNASQEAVPVIKEKTDHNIRLERDTIPIIPPLKLISPPLHKQSSGESEVGSPLENLMAKSKAASSPGGLTKTNLFGLGARNSAFHSFHTTCITPSFSATMSATVPKPVGILKNLEKKKETPKVKVQSNRQKPLFEAFNVGDTTNVDYYKLFTTLINIKKK